LFKTSKAKYVAPAPIEMKLSANKNIEQVCVVGSGLPQPMALVTISDYGKTKDKEALTNSLKKTLDIVNLKFEQHEHLRKMVVIDTEWTMENNLLTPSMKIKRKEVENTYQQSYQNWYDSKDRIVY
jgi:long-chain acyl-CoA synthetase